MSDVSVAGNHSVGKGRCWFNRKTAAGVYTGERYIGNNDAFDTQANDTVLKVFDSGSRNRGLVATALQQREMTAKFKLRELMKENLALLWMGDNAQITQSNTPVVDEPIVAATVFKDRKYQLGGYGTPARNVSAVTVKHTSGSPTYVVDVDYKLNATEGTIYIIPGGAIAEGVALKVSYAKSNTPFDIVNLGSVPFIEGAMRFSADPAYGPVIDTLLWNVQMRPSSPVPLIGEEFVSIDMELSILDDSATAGHSTCPFGIAYPRATF